MHKAVYTARKVILYSSALVLVAGYPMTAMATSQDPATSTESPVIEQLGTQAPEEQKQAPTYTYDPTIKKWNSDGWQWNPESGAYEQPPKPVVIEPEQANPSVQQEQPAAQESSEQTTDKTVDTTVDVKNDVTSGATSGDALISGNTKAGNALSGDATAVANIINAVNSSVSTGENQKVATFTKDVMGDVTGDIILYPMLLKAMLEQKAQNNASTAINATTNFDLNNNINLDAQTGNATVENNTNAGDATTGSATAMANVINILNSMIATQDSFIGTINIYGSLEGDILIAPDFIPQMLENNGGSNSDSKLSTQDTATIVNNISAVADSGAASVFGNTNGGTASSGNADSNVVIFNVTGRDIVAENSMLVFVNVLGKWVGMIVDAPQGATAAMIGSGVQSNGSYAPDLTLESKSKHGITNTIAVNAGSGDATVADNTTAGNATSGDAHAFANVANVSNSSLSLTGWFGILFINITGDWFGSFQVDTPFGNKSVLEQAPNPTGPAQFIPKGESTQQKPKPSLAHVIVDSRYLANTASAANVNMDTQAKTAAANLTSKHIEGEVLGETDVKNADEGGNGNDNLFFIVVGSIILIGGSVVGVRRFII